MSYPRQSAQLIPIGEVQRLVQERRRRPRHDAGSDAYRAVRSTSEVRRLLTEPRPDSPSGPEAA